MDYPTHYFQEFSILPNKNTSMNLLFEISFKLTLNVEVETLLAVIINVFLLEQLQESKNWWTHIITRSSLRIVVCKL
jgi:hypothetical protein